MNDINYNFSINLINASAIRHVESTAVVMETNHVTPIDGGEMSEGMDELIALINIDQ